MKTTIKGLAVLMVLMTATMFSSCNKNEFDSVSSDQVVTITIAPSSADATKVTTTETTKLTVTGWELGDQVTMVKLKGSDGVPYYADFTCTNASTGTFSGSLPAGVSAVSEFQYAVYNGKNFVENTSESSLRFEAKNKVSTNVKDVIVMYAVKDGGGKYAMKVCGNILKATNDLGSAIEVQVLRYFPSISQYYRPKLYTKIDTSTGYLIVNGTIYEDSTFDAEKFVLPKGVSYVYLPSTDAYNQFGLCDAFDTADSPSIVPFKLIGVSGCMYTRTIVPKGSLSSVFSVSSTKKVHFAKGNLRATITAAGVPTAWKFAPQQYAALGEGGANKTIGSAGGDIDLFGWVGANSSLDAYGISTDTDPSHYGNTYPENLKSDWGTTMGGIWRTLTASEWEYLLTTRGTGDKYFKCDVTVVGIANCLVIAPDGYTGPDIKSEYDYGDWQTAENDYGLVCLPPTGNREGSTIDSPSIAKYWSATAATISQANFLTFYSGHVYPTEKQTRDFGYAVRLVTDAN